MAIGKKNPGARLARRATRRSSLHGRDPHRKKSILLCLLLGFIVIIAALVWGNMLKAESDALRAAEEAGEWTLEADTATPLPTVVSAVNAGYAAPGEKMQTIPELTYNAVTFDLGSCLSPLPYAVELPPSSGMTVHTDAPALSAEVTRFHKADLLVIGVFTVTSLDTTDMTERALRHGQEMTLLSLYAKAGVDRLLLLGLPSGSDSSDTAAVTYLTDVKTLLASIPAATPELGVAVSPAAFVGEINEAGDFVYAGSLTPGRLLSACDYLTLDLRGIGSGTSDILKDMQYAYVRYQLYLLTPMSSTEATAAVTHGFSRILMFGHS
ncbi:MAG: hypothetical protein E7661_03065 [Ruminococcaceae bacterium]|nr:hypothetical protein [Oscillospiraceae bacterium]